VRAAKQHGVVVRALELAAKLVGLLRERVEITHEFAGLKDSAEILAQIRIELGDDAANAIERALAPVADCAPVVPAPKIDQSDQ
jgi:hypothetical protein